MKLIESQKQFMKLHCRFPAYFAGYGSGKTQAKLYRALVDKFIIAPESSIALYDPTYDLARLNTIPRLLEMLDSMPVKYIYDKMSSMINVQGFGSFIIRTLDNPDRIIAYEVFRSHVDELDTLKANKAEEAWNKIIARNRQQVKSKAINRVYVYTTPEGFRFCYKRWVKKGGKDYKYIQARTEDNPYLPDGYIQSLRDTYSDNLLAAYLNGQFVNLTSGTVFASYDRERNNSTETIQPGQRLLIGCDFNVTKQMAVIHVLKDGKPHAVAELIDMYDTPSMIKTIKELYPKHNIIMYPDSSGKSRKTVDASSSDIALLQQAGFSVRAHRANPRIKDRINATNIMFQKQNYFVNVKKCPEYAEALEQLAYDKNGVPDKTSGFDHETDAGTYYIAYEFPIKTKGGVATTGW